MNTTPLLTRSIAMVITFGCSGHPPREPVASGQDQAAEDTRSPQPSPASEISGQALPTPKDAGIRFRTTHARVPVAPSCFNKEKGGGFAKELINPMERVVVVHGGASPIQDDAWPSFQPREPWSKNQDLHSRFTEHCVYRSPKSPADCQADACATHRTISDHTWNEVATLLAQDCLPKGSTGCTGMGAAPGAFAITVLRKCQSFILAGERFVASDGRGNRYVIHATESETPRLDASLPDGWTLERIETDEPLEITPFGEGDDCYHVVGHDNLRQLYTQYAFAGDAFPEGAPPELWETLTKTKIIEALTGHSVAWPGQGNQTWTADGRTTTPHAEGHWKIQGTEYCSQFPQQGWRCFTVEMSPDEKRIRVTGDGQVAWIGAFVE